MDKKSAMLPMILAVGATMIYFMALSSREKQLSQAYQLANVVVAKVDLPARTVLKPELVDMVQIPRKYMESDAFEVKSSQDLKSIENLVTQIRIPKGNQIVKSACISLSSKAGLSVKIPPGYRGAALPVDNELLRLVKPSDRVDILVTFEAVMADGHKERVTATILQNVLVLGVGADLGQGRTAEEEKGREKAEAAQAQFSDKGALSLALNPAEAQYLALSMKQGDVTVVIRGLGDVEMHPIEMASFQKLFR